MNSSAPVRSQRLAQKGRRRWGKPSPQALKYARVLTEAGWVEEVDAPSLVTEQRARPANNPWGRKGKPKSELSEKRPPIIIRIRQRGGNPEVVLPQDFESVHGQGDIIGEESKKKKKKKCSKRSATLPREERFSRGQKRARARNIGQEGGACAKKLKPTNPYVGASRPTLVAKRGGYSDFYAGKSKEQPIIKVTRPVQVAPSSPLTESQTQLSPIAILPPKKLCLHSWSLDKNSPSLPVKKVCLRKWLSSSTSSDGLLQTSTSSPNPDSSSESTGSVDTSAETEVEMDSPSPPLVVDLSPVEEDKSPVSERQELPSLVVDAPVLHNAGVYIPPPVRKIVNPFLRELGDLVPTTTPRVTVLHPREGGSRLLERRSDTSTCARARSFSRDPRPYKPEVRKASSTSCMPTAVQSESETISSVAPNVNPFSLLRSRLTSESSQPSTSNVNWKPKLPALLRSTAYLSGYKAALVQGGLTPRLNERGQLDIRVDQEPVKPPIMADIQTAYEGVTKLWPLSTPKGVRPTLQEMVAKRRALASLEAKTEEVFVNFPEGKIPNVDVDVRGLLSRPLPLLPASTTSVVSRTAKVGVPSSTVTSSSGLGAIDLTPSVHQTRVLLDSEPSSTVTSATQAAILPTGHASDPFGVIPSPNLDLVPLHQRVKTSGAVLQLQVGSNLLPTGELRHNPRQGFVRGSRYQEWLDRSDWKEEEDAFLAVSRLVIIISVIIISS